MKRSYLIQRLTAPRGPNPFSFGGGLRNGGLSDDAMALLRDICSFDYMGSAEFEFGAVPEAFQRLATATQNVGFSISVPLAEVPAQWRDTRPAPEGDATIYVLAPKSIAEEVGDRVGELARDAYDERLKEPTRLAAALRPFKEWDSETCGWLELDNGFMFFTDPQMWQRCCELFSAEVSERV